MKQREKTILILALIAVAYAVYVLFLSGPTQVTPIKPEVQLEQARTFASDVATLLAEDDTSDTDTYIITQAVTEWGRRPFLVSAEPIGAEPSLTESDEGANAVPFAYTGYLNSGHKTLAVINGMEYEEGEVLTSGGHVIRAISMSRVIIENSADKTTINLPMDAANTSSLTDESETKVAK